MFDLRSDLFILRQLNAANSSLSPKLTPDDLYWGGSKNVLAKSYVPLVAQLDSAYTGYLNLEYDKFDLSQAFKGIVPKIAGVSRPTLHALLPTLNQSLGLSLAPIDVRNVQLKWLGDGEQINILIQALPSSPLFRGEVVVHYTQRRYLLSESVLVRELDALADAPDMITTRTWSLDFTPYNHLLTVRQNQWVYPEEVERILNDLGLTDLDLSPVVEYLDTSLVPDANSSYTHVYKQQLEQGLLYLHVRSE